MQWYFVLLIVWDFSKYTSISCSSKTKKGDVMKVNIDISQENRRALSDMMSRLVADEFVLYVKTLNFHWNVYGPFFNDLHLFFGKQYEQILEIIDEVAERIRQLGGKAPGTMQEFLKYTQLQEKPGDVAVHTDMIEQLLNDHETIIRTLRFVVEDALNKYKDAGTNNFLTDVMEQHEKMAWMLRSFLEKEGWMFASYLEKK